MPCQVHSARLPQSGSLALWSRVPLSGAGRRWCSSTYYATFRSSRLTESPRGSLGSEAQRPEMTGPAAGRAPGLRRTRPAVERLAARAGLRRTGLAKEKAARLPQTRGEAEGCVGERPARSGQRRASSRVGMGAEATVCRAT